MNNQTLDHAIEIHDEMIALDDILNAASNQSYLTFAFTSTSTPGRIDKTFTIKNEDLVYIILTQIKLRKELLEEEFKEL